MVSKLVSIVIPFYNRFVFLHEAIMCVVRQSYRPIEIILVDDCSDKPFSLDQYHDLGVPIAYIRNHTNVGPAMSRFLGLDRCKGEYVVFLDSDDQLAPLFVEKQVCTLESSDDAVFAYCFTKEFNSSGVLRDRRGSQACINRILPDVILNGRMWCTSSCLWTKKFLMSVERFAGYRWEDYRLDISVALLRNVVACTPEYLCFYRVDSDAKLSLSASNDQVKLLYSLDGILRTIWLAGRRFPEFDRAIGKMASKYVTCLMKLNHDPAIRQYCANASRVKLFPKTLRFWFHVAKVVPARPRILAFRIAKRSIRKSFAGGGAK